MQLSKVKRFVSDTMLNLRGWNTNRKIVVIESDDWGSIRMPSKEVYERLLSQGVRVDNCPYTKYDSLESEDDLTCLFDVLKKYKDSYGNQAIITANYIMSNPDFDKMNLDFPIVYKNELFTETYKKYPSHNNSFKILRNGINESLFHPQFHGREHVNIKRWLNGLNNGFEETKLAFKNKLFGIGKSISSEDRLTYLAAFHYSCAEEMNDYATIISEGLQYFENVFNFRSTSFIAPNYSWCDEVELALFNANVNQIQSARVQMKSSADFKNSIVRHHTGQRNKFNQFYTVRNCFFEPSQEMGAREKSVFQCLKEIDNAFSWKTPAIICSHRLNYIGSIVERNKVENLKHLALLLETILKKWPDVEFMSSDRLGNIISKNN